MKLDTVLTNFRGEELKIDNDLFTIGRALAEVMVEPREVHLFSRGKEYDLAEHFFRDKEITLDPDDIAKIKQMVEKSNVIYTIAAGQVLRALNAEK